MKIYRIAETPKAHRRRRLQEDWLPICREEAHRYFDKLWQEPKYGFSREEAYAALAESFNLPPEKAHMSRMGPQQCKEVAEWAKNVMQALDQMDDEFGVTYDRDGKIHTDRVAKNVTADSDYLSIGHGYSPYALWIYKGGKFESTEMIDPEDLTQPPKDHNSEWPNAKWLELLAGRFDQGTNKVSVAGATRDGEIPKIVERNLRSRFGNDIELVNYLTIKKTFSGKFKMYRIALPLPLDSIPAEEGEVLVDMLLTDNMIKELDNRYGFKEHLGGGMWGAAFLTHDNKVLKLTTDNLEIEAAGQIQNIGYGPFAAVYEIGKVKNEKTGRDMTYILKEFVSPLEGTLKQVFEDLSYDFGHDDYAVEETRKAYPEEFEKVEDYFNDVEGFPFSDTMREDNVGINAEGEIIAFDARMHEPIGMFQ